MWFPLGLLLSLVVVASCESPGGGRVGQPGPVRSASPSTRTPSTTAPTGAPTRQPSATSIPTFSEVYAVSCAGYPTADQVVAALRRTGSSVLPAGAQVTVQMAPQCSGTWQYTILGVPQRDPLQVITKGAPAALQLVTAGTDVCTIPVLTEAPYGIRTLARCPTS
jgi:hypothetical protein